MRLRSLAALFVSAWVFGALPIAIGCNGSDDAPAGAPGEPTMHSGDLVRGLLGARSVASTEDRATSRAYDAVADALVAEIDAASPGRVARLEADLRSNDPERMVAAKKEIDQALAGAAASDGLARRIAGGGLVTQGLRPLDQAGSGSLVMPGGDKLAGDASKLICEQPKGSDGMPMHLGSVGGTYGDSRTGLTGAARDTPDLVDTTDLNLFRTLRRVDSGELTPNPDSRLGAYAATGGFPAGTVGNAVHNAIGTIYITFANYGQENIGRVFNSPEARALYNQPVASCAGAQMAMLEYQYWSDVRAEDPASPGGNMGSAFNPTIRNLLQTTVFDR